MTSRKWERGLETLLGKTNIMDIARFFLIEPELRQKHACVLENYRPKIQEELARIRRSVENRIRLGTNPTVNDFHIFSWVGAAVLFPDDFKPTDITHDWYVRAEQECLSVMNIGAFQSDFLWTASLDPAVQKTFKQKAQKKWRDVLRYFPAEPAEYEELRELIAPAYSRAMYMLINPERREDLKVSPEHWKLLRKLERSGKMSFYDYSKLVFALTILGADQAELFCPPRLEYTLPALAPGQASALPPRSQL